MQEEGRQNRQYSVKENLAGDKYGRITPIATAGTVLMPLMPLTVLNVKINAMVLEEYKTAIP